MNPETFQHLLNYATMVMFGDYGIRIFCMKNHGKLNAITRLSCRLSQLVGWIGLAIIALNIFLNSVLYWMNLLAPGG